MTELDDGLSITPRPLTGGVFATYDDHRLATAAAVLGLCVPGIEVENVETTAKTLPGFVDLWTGMLAVSRDAGKRWSNRRPPRPRRGRRAHPPVERARGRARRTALATRTPPAAVVVAVDRGRYSTHVDGRDVTAMKARELGRGRVVVGDRVALVGDVSGEPDALARIVRVEPRRSTLRRTADDTDPVERIIVANAEQLVIVTALADPPPRPRLIDRCLVAAFDAGLDALLCLTKPDLTGPEELLETYGALAVPHVVVRRGAPLDDLVERGWSTA